MKCELVCPYNWENSCNYEHLVKVWKFNKIPKVCPRCVPFDELYKNGITWNKILGVFREHPCLTVFQLSKMLILNSIKTRIRKRPELKLRVQLANVLKRMVSLRLLYVTPKTSKSAKDRFKLHSHFHFLNGAFGFENVIWKCFEINAKNLCENRSTTKSKGGRRVGSEGADASELVRRSGGIDVGVVPRKSRSQDSQPEGTAQDSPKGLPVCDELNADEVGKPRESTVERRKAEWETPAHSGCENTPEKKVVVPEVERRGRSGKPSAISSKAIPHQHGDSAVASVLGLPAEGRALAIGSVIVNERMVAGVRQGGLAEAQRFPN